jgi:hypothetical protein
MPILTPKTASLLLIALLLSAPMAAAEEATETSAEAEDNQAQIPPSCPLIRVELYAPFVFVYPDCL